MGAQTKCLRSAREWLTSQHSRGTQIVWKITSSNATAKILINSNLSRLSESSGNTLIIRLITLKTPRLSAKVAQNCTAHSTPQPRKESIRGRYGAENDMGNQNEKLYEENRLIMESNTRAIYAIVWGQCSPATNAIEVRVTWQFQDQKREVQLHLDPKGNLGDHTQIRRYTQHLYFPRWHLELVLQLQTVTDPDSTQISKRFPIFNTSVGTLRSGPWSRWSVPRVNQETSPCWHTKSNRPQNKQESNRLGETKSDCSRFSEESRQEKVWCTMEQTGKHFHIRTRSVPSRHNQCVQLACYLQVSPLTDTTRQPHAP